MLCNISNILIAVSCLHTFCCLDYGPYPFCGGDCLDPCVFEWSHYFGEDGLELDAGVVSTRDVTYTQSQIAAISKSVPSVQGRLKQHESFWLDELEPSSFVAGIVTVGYRLPFLRFPDPLFQMNHRSVVENALFASRAIDELVLGRCVVECEFCSNVCSPLFVVTNATCS